MVLQRLLLLLEMGRERSMHLLPIRARDDTALLLDASRVRCARPTPFPLAVCMAFFSAASEDERLQAESALACTSHP